MELKNKLNIPSLNVHIIIALQCEFKNFSASLIRYFDTNQPYDHMHLQYLAL